MRKEEAADEQAAEEQSEEQDKEKNQDAADGKKTRPKRHSKRQPTGRQATQSLLHVLNADARPPFPLTHPPKHHYSRSSLLVMCTITSPLPTIPQRLLLTHNRNGHNLANQEPDALRYRPSSPSSSAAFSRRSVPDSKLFASPPLPHGLHERCV
ncbi:hypothetical protein CDD80_4299 [Ophiocordyceps camponoti-rufipedis]|uniref:Uncharacterized protein n=1 Tax=Ophiocordyceps camponoti-rufipedis TaxID=2004952 RepID=A0A2C5Y3Q0_9HYPO|nr:hypothetical protein CDD80_4299 [Ophiocordyceps camponoti-rufipedis]